MKEETSELKNEIQRGNKTSEATDLVKIASLDDYVSTSNLEIDGERHMMVENLNLKYGTELMHSPRNHAESLDAFL